MSAISRHDYFADDETDGEPGFPWGVVDPYSVYGQPVGAAADQGAGDIVPQDQLGAAGDKESGAIAPQVEPCPYCHSSGICESCHGDGQDPDDPTKYCPLCDGSGHCPDCAGSGQFRDPTLDPCPGCGANTLYFGDDQRFHCAQCNWDDSEWFDFTYPADPGEASDFDLDLGACCICQATEQQARNILMLDHPGPTPGKGWGCFTCGLPANGALAVLCDACFDLYQAGEPLRSICTGYPAKDGRTPYDRMSQESFEHNMDLHPEAIE